MSRVYWKDTSTVHKVQINCCLNLFWKVR